MNLKVFQLFVPCVLVQDSSNLALLSFSYNPNQTHLKMLINIFRINVKLQAGEFDQVRKLNRAGQLTSKIRVEEPWLRGFKKEKKGMR